MLKIRLAWLWWPRVWHVLPRLRDIWLVDLTCERHKRHEREFCTRPFKLTELEKGRWSWISNYGEALHTDSWLAEANPGHSDRDAILQGLLPGPSTVVLFGPGKARMGVTGTTYYWMLTKPRNWLLSFWKEQGGIKTGYTKRRGGLTGRDTYKNLGIVLDNALRWKDDIEAILPRACSRVYCLRKLRSLGVSSQLLQMFYTFMTSSVFTFGLTCWEGRSQSRTTAE